MDHETDTSDALTRCPFVRAVAAGNHDTARTIATRGDDPAEPLVVDWLIAEAERQLAELPATRTPAD
jgi:hypothetical protein